MVGRDNDGAACEVAAAQLSLPLTPPPLPAVSPKPNPYSFAPPDDFENHEGGGFHYENCSSVFLGRTGYGPMRVAWDTNILIDYGTYGHLLWGDGEFDPPVAEKKYRDQLLAFATFVHLWMIRDIRIWMPRRQVFDSRRRLSVNEWHEREYRIRQCQSALECVDQDVEIREKVEPFENLPDGSVNDQWDLSLLLEAIENGCHVFLTRDDRLVRRLRETALAALVLVTSPRDLIHALGEAEELRMGYMLPDTHKWQHFMLAAERRDC